MGESRDLGKLPRPPLSKPQGVKVVVVLLRIVFALVLLVDVLQLLASRAPPGDWGSHVPGFALGGLILVGLQRGHALAWQWGMVMTTLTALSALVNLVIVLGAHNPGPVLLGKFGSMTIFFVHDPRPLLLVAFVLVLATIPFLLARRDARVFFGLQCPACQEVRGNAASFLFTKRRCRVCGVTWRY